MIDILLSLAIVTAGQPASIDAVPAPAAHAAEVFRCDFEAASDVNYDRWPDDWKRRSGPGFPHYVDVAIEDDNSGNASPANRTLNIKLDGGAAAVFSPPVSVSSQFSYVLEARCRTEHLKFNVAFISITFLDADKTPIAIHRSTGERDASEWNGLRIGPVTTIDNRAVRAVVGLHLEPQQNGAAGDIVGSAQFDDVRLVRFPRMSLESNNSHNLYTDPHSVEVECHVSGIDELRPKMKFELFDVFGRLLAEQTVMSVDAHEQQTIETADASAQWKPPIDEYGFYRVRVSIVGDATQALQRQLTLAILRDLPRSEHGQFGWSLPQPDDSFDPKHASDLLDQAGIHWAKLPVWVSDQRPDAAERFAELAERLYARGIEMVGVLDQPPADLRERFGSGSELLVASMFNEPEVWQPAVDPVMTRLSLKIRWWQLGADEDVSFIGVPDLEKRIAGIKEHLERFGQEIRLGFAWRWLYDPPSSNHPTWDFLSESAEPSQTVEQLNQHLTAAILERAHRWVMLRPLSRDDHDLPNRAHDLVTRMLAAKIHGADAVFATNPLNAQNGLLNPDGTPSELFLPWRTTALMLSGAEYMGSIQLPGGSTNHLFSRDGQAIMVVWNDRRTHETLYLGDDVRQIDLWGREKIPHHDENRQAIEVDTLPTFVTGLHEPIARWRMSFQFDEGPLASVFGRPQPMSLSFKNTFPQGASGQLTLHAPDMWDAQPQFSLRLPIDGEQDESFPIQLRSTAKTGPQPLRADFEITADRNYKFSIYRTVQVGLGDVVVNLSAELDDQNNLVVTQQLENKTDTFVSFNCSLFAPDRRRQKTQVLNLSRGHNVKKYYFTNGHQLIGQTLWLRAEEINGHRVLNYHILVEQ